MCDGESVVQIIQREYEWNGCKFTIISDSFDSSPKHVYIAYSFVLRAYFGLDKNFTSSLFLILLYLFGETHRYHGYRLFIPWDYISPSKFVFFWKKTQIVGDFRNFPLKYSRKIKIYLSLHMQLYLWWDVKERMYFIFVDNERRHACFIIFFSDFQSLAIGCDMWEFRRGLRRKFSGGPSRKNPSKFKHFLKSKGAPPRCWRGSKSLCRSLWRHVAYRVVTRP